MDNTVYTNPFTVGQTVICVDDTSVSAAVTISAAYRVEAYIPDEKDGDKVVIRDNWQDLELVPASDFKAEVEEVEEEEEPEASENSYTHYHTSNLGTSLRYDGGTSYIITTGKWKGTGYDLFQISARLDENMLALVIGGKRVLLTFEQANEFSHLLNEVLEVWAFRRDVSEDASEVGESLAA